MRLATVTLVRNEADVIEAFVRHHCAIVDEMRIVDHHSCDGTAEMLRELRGEGLPIVLDREPSLVHRQAPALTAAMREAGRAGADWVVPLDADEFLVADSGDARTAFARLDSGRPALARLRSYVPTPADDLAEPNVLRRIVHRRRSETDAWSRKVLVPRPLTVDSRWAIAQGSHGVVDPDGRPAPALPAGLALAHYPVRSAEQLALKVLPGWLANLARPDRLPAEAFQWKRAFDAILSGDRLDAEQLQRIALAYATHRPTTETDDELVRDPVPVGFQLRLAVPRRPDVLSVLAGTAEGLIAELSAAGGRSDREEQATA